MTTRAGPTSNATKPLILRQTNSPSLFRQRFHVIESGSMICPSKHIDYQDKVGAWLLADEPLPDMFPDCEGKSRPLNRMTNAKPRRPARNSSKAWTNFEIMDEENEKTDFLAPAPSGHIAMNGTQDDTIKMPFPLSSRRTSMFSKPAQRLSLASKESLGNGIAQKERRLSTMTATQDSHESNFSEDTMNSTLARIPEYQSTIKRHPRRKTVFIPSDNTTMTTINPCPNDQRAQPKAMSTSDMFLDLAEIPESTEKPRSPLTRRTLRVSLAGAPRRAPLQMYKAQENQLNISHNDVRGVGPGKENLPPGYTQKGLKSNTEKRLSSLTTSKAISSSLDSGTDIQGTMKPVGSHEAVWKSLEQSMEHKNTDLSNKSSNGKASRKSDVNNLRTARGPDDCNQRPRAASSRTAFRRMSALPKLCEAKEARPTYRMSHISSSRYSVIAEDLTSSELFEDQWLKHQEIAMSQMINLIFRRASHPANPTCPVAQNARQSLLAIYQDSTNGLLSKRIRASLQFGALSISQEAMVQVSRIRFDLGQKQRFLDLWLKTYNLTALQTAAEVVLAHEIKTPFSARHVSQSCVEMIGEQATAKEIANFLHTFLVENSDNHSKRQTCVLPEYNNRHTGIPGGADESWSWRRTVLRSLMIILLLDHAKNEGIFQGCLFQRSASCKSSSSVLLALAKILLPSVGDVSRTLSHLNYRVSHVQHPLEEYESEIKNLAIDLRDGIQLTRLVEILMQHSGQPSSSSSEQHMNTLEPNDDVITDLKRPSVDSSFAMGYNQRLSSLLKYPCSGRPQKLYNVEVALSVVQLSSAAGMLFKDFKAEHVVDGHREKTLDLLWTLFSIWGFEALIDRKLLEREIHRTRKTFDLPSSNKRRRCAYSSKCDTTPSMILSDKSKLPQARKDAELLLKWVQNVGKLHNIQIHNLNTCFADGRAFHSIFVEYRHVLCANTASRSSIVNNLLPELLQIFGYTKEFATLFPPVKISTPHITKEHHNTNILTEKTVIPMLTVLASWMLPAAQPHFAATIIQRAWRNASCRKSVKRRLICARLAHDCALVIRYRERIEWAARVIQRKWRNIYDKQSCFRSIYHHGICLP